MPMQVQHSGEPQTYEKAFTVLVLLLMTGAFVNLTVKPGLNTEQASGVLWMQIAWALIYLSTFRLLRLHCRDFLQHFLREPFLVLLPCLALLSTLWSDAPSVTFRRSVALIGTSFFGLYVAIRYDVKDQLRMLSKMCWIAVIGSFLFHLLGLGSSVDELPGAWYGIYAQKNVLGGVMVLSTLIFWFVGKISPGKELSSRIGVLLSFVLILLSRSAGALVSFALLIVFYSIVPVLRMSRWRQFLLLTLLTVCGGLGIYWILYHLDLVTAALNRDVTLSGRLYLWILSAYMALRRPWLGYGYSAFWLGSEGASAFIWKALKWPAPGAHNGLLQLMLDLGLAGIVLFLIGFLIYVWKAIRLYRAETSLAAAWPLLFMTFLAVWNLTESAIVGSNTLYWTLYTTVAITASVELRKSAVPALSRNPGRSLAGNESFLPHEAYAASPEQID